MHTLKALCRGELTWRKTQLKSARSSEGGALFQVHKPIHFWQPRPEMKRHTKRLVRRFRDYKPDAANWITLSTGEYYPDILKDACNLYTPVLRSFEQLLRCAGSSIALFMAIQTEIPNPWMRVQLARVFRKYVSPETPVEMLKKKTQAQAICDQFGKGFRAINEVQRAFNSRPIEDEAICAILWEYKDRGRKGYDLTEKFFDSIRAQFPDLVIIGPERAGKDVLLGKVWSDYPKKDRPVDFVIYTADKARVLSIGLARYDSDRGGAQEDDRTGGYRNAADEILRYCEAKGYDTNVIFLNDGPGLLLGTMWDDYADLEESHEGRILVLTLRMIPERITKQWLKV